ncbi:phosphotransferase family protein [Thermasporomyces composti]|uniref:Aminoglycoside phosphotransferase (APT) family kinase protein n=1 Tax=Thermasporomyces composti TaxID=696763 RepID=A0A3D9VBI4_THECX|nr:aminoglycoside phosphotransferase family protein [Thermasporomyces composti]REF36395.1 aminoglycoside phosphotransferase (APT) family kinase protein [Thermasporomyces composti]
MDVVAVAERLLGTTPVGVRPTGSDGVYLLDMGTRTVVLKLSTHGHSVLAEARAYQAAAAHDVRVPRVLATGTDPEAMALEFLDGVSLWSEERRDKDNSFAWRRAGEDLRTLHEIRLPGFGPIVPDGRGIAGHADSWCPFVRSAREDGIRTLVDAGVLDSRVGRRLEARYDEAAADLHSWSDGRLLHGDLEGGHILVSGDEYLGLIDFDQAQVGDPRWDLARVPLWDGVAALDALLDGYGRDTLGPGDRELLLPLYLLAFVIHHAVRFADEGDVEKARGHLAQTQYERLV